jgi:hypothetical protein
MSFLFTDQQKRYQSNDPFSNRNHEAREGELRIDHVPDKKKRDNKNFEGGEYVDYEELK